METANPRTKNIFIAEANFALDKMLSDKIVVPDGLGSKKSVPIFFRDRDSKIIPDTTAGGLISVGYNGYVLAPVDFWDQCGITEVVETDADGLPLKYREVPAPDPVAMRYTITARSQHWDDMIAMETQLASIFPVTNTLIEIDGFKTWMLRTGYHAADDIALGIFIRNISVEIIGLVFKDNCDSKIEYAIKHATLEMNTNEDPDSDPIETVEIFD